MNPSLIFAIPCIKEIEPLVDLWVKSVQKHDSYLRSDLGKGPHEGYLLHVVFDGIIQIDGDFVHYNTKVYPAKIEEIKDGESKLKNLTGGYAVIPEKKSIWSFLEYKDTPSSVVTPSNNEEVSCTMREYFLNGKLYSVAIFNAADETQHFEECGE